MGKKGNTVYRRRDLASIVAGMHRVSSDYVRKIARGDRTNEKVFTTYMALLQEDNQLLKAVEKIVPLEGDFSDNLNAVRHEDH